MNFYIRVAQEVALLSLEKMLPRVEIKESAGSCWIWLALVIKVINENELKPFKVE